MVLSAKIHFLALPTFAFFKHKQNHGTLTVAYSFTEETQEKRELYNGASPAAAEK